MPKIQKPDRKFVYISPLKGCENENACLIAGLVEQFMISSIEMQIELVQGKIKQIYKYADKFMKERRSNQCHI
jgi:hypothetical protein